MNELAKITTPAAPQSVTTGPIAGSRKVYAAPKGHRGNPRALPRNRAQRSRASRRCASTTPPAPIPRRTRASISAAGLPPVREAWIAARGYAAIPGREIKPEDNGHVSAERLAPHCPATRTLRAGAPGQLVTQYEFARAGIVTRGDDLRRAPREPRARGGGGGGRGAARRRRELRRRDPRIRHPGIRALGDRARPRHHSRQHQPRRTRADGDRPQLPRQGQRQHRQQRGQLRRRRGSREDGVGDPLGRRHGDGPLDGPQHPQHPLLDPAQLARCRSARCRSIRRWKRSTAIR